MFDQTKCTFNSAFVSQTYLYSLKHLLILTVWSAHFCSDILWVVDMNKTIRGCLFLLYCGFVACFQG